MSTTTTPQVGTVEYYRVKLGEWTDRHDRYVALVGHLKSAIRDYGDLDGARNALDAFDQLRDEAAHREAVSGQ